MPAVAHHYFGAMHQSLSLQYAPCDCEACQEAKLSSAQEPPKKPLDLTKVAKKAFDQLHKRGNYRPEDLMKYKAYRDLITATSEVFNTAIPHEVPEEMKAYLERDVFIFSGLKTHTQLTEARSKLKDEQGNVRPYYQFEQEILKLNNTYNRNYLEAEYQFAVQSAQSATNWANLQEDTSRYWLEYRTAGDERVRQSHAALAGICLPKDDAFWTEYYPPNGWRCRCTAVEVLARENTKSNPETAKKAGEEATTQIGKSGKNKLEMFRFNPGQEKKVFPPTNTYTQVVGAEQVQQALNNIQQRQEPEYTPTNIPTYESQLNITVNRSIFGGLTRETPLYFKEPSEYRTISGAYYSPIGNFVKIPIDSRRRESNWYAEAVVYHEFGHAIDAHIGMRQDVKVIEVMDKHRNIFAENRNKGYIEVQNMLNKKLKEARIVEDHNLMEQIGACSDTLMSLNTNFGSGHTKSYFNREGMKEAEFIAHAFENTFAGNEVFKETMPVLYEDMINMINKFMPK